MDHARREQFRSSAVARLNGPSWVASVVNAIGESSYWNCTAIVIVWDDWGGFYDNYAPPSFDHWGGLGFRVPMIVVSPYAREAQKGQPGYISHTPVRVRQHPEVHGGYVLRLGSLHTTDSARPASSDCFDFSQSPRAFVPIGSKYSRPTSNGSGRRTNRWIRNRWV